MQEMNNLHQYQTIALFLETAFQVIHGLYEFEIVYFAVLWAVALKGTSCFK